MTNSPRLLSIHHMVICFRSFHAGLMSCLLSEHRVRNHWCQLHWPLTPRIDQVDHRWGLKVGRFQWPEHLKRPQEQLHSGQGIQKQRHQDYRVADHDDNQDWPGQIGRCFKSQFLDDSSNLSSRNGDEPSQCYVQRNLTDYRSLSPRGRELGISQG